MEDPSLEWIPATSNKALGELLVTKSLIDTCWQKLVSNLSMNLQQNKSKHLSPSRKQRLNVNAPSRKQNPIAHWPSMRWRVREPLRLAPIQQSHTKDVQHLEEESLEEERRGQLNFLSTCQTTLDTTPPESHGMLIAPYHLLLGHVPKSNLFTIPPRASPP